MKKIILALSVLACSAVVSADTMSFNDDNGIKYSVSPSTAIQAKTKDGSYAWSVIVDQVAPDGKAGRYRTVVTGCDNEEGGKIKTIGLHGEPTGVGPFDWDWQLAISGDGKVYDALAAYTCKAWLEKSRSEDTPKKSTGKSV